jgi:uncharacterized protein
MENPHSLNWFEIPCVNFERATRFYSTIFNQPLKTISMEVDGKTEYLCMLPRGDKGVGGAVSTDSTLKPSTDGVMLYLNGGNDLGEILNRVEDAGGIVNFPKTLVTKEVGFIGRFIDSEGNLIGLHSEM